MADTRTLEDRNRAKAIRAWAPEHGYQVAARGTLPANVIEAYDHWLAGFKRDPADAADPGPDWDEAAAGVGDVADLEDEPAAAADTEAARPEPGQAPPADLDEARARAGAAKRRTPAWARGRGGERAARPAQPPPVKVTRELRGDIEGKLALLLSVPAATWTMADPYCGRAFADNVDNIVRKSVPLICQSPEAVRWFTRGTTFMLWMDLAVACQPVAVAVYRHHAGPQQQRDEIEAMIDGRPVQRAPQPGPAAYPADVFAGHVPTPRPA
jgi:hypothetical protein